MAFWKNALKNNRTLDSFGVSTNQNMGQGGQREFYEMELGVVLDIVMDENHPIYSTSEVRHKTIDANRWPLDCKDRPPSDGDKDYTWIGRALIRPLVSELITEKDQLFWAYPMESNVSEWPLINETVVVVRYPAQNGTMYYSRKLNYHNWTNNNLDFGVNTDISGLQNKEIYSDGAYSGRGPSLTGWKGTQSYKGFAGKYYIANNHIRTVHRWEGDLLFESRHGQTVHLTAYDKNRKNDVGDSELYPFYKDDGNPMIMIRNRQRKLLDVGETLSLHDSPNPATVVGTIHEKNVGGYLHENINHDGSSIYITCGLTISEWVTTCYKRMFHDDKDEEVPKFKGPSTFVYPALNKEQIVINSDRLIFSSRYAETFHYSKKRYGIVTDSEYTVDAHDQIVLTTHKKTVINSPAIYLGEIDKTDEPVLLGQTTVNWLYELCNWLLMHVHWHHHTHLDNIDQGDGNTVKVGEEDPHKTQEPVQRQELIQLRNTLHQLMSRRVFVTGGGFAPGQDGAQIPGGVPPTKITIDNKF